MNIIDWDGKQITEPGIYRGISLDDYHSADICDGPSVSSSVLRTIIGQSPAHYWLNSPYNEAEVERRKKEEKKPEPKHFALGRAVHHLHLGQPHFAKEFIVRPANYLGEPWHGNRTVCKKWLADHAKLTILTPEMAEAVIGMHNVLVREPLIKSGMLRGKVEHSMIARHPKSGIWLKVRPDAIPTADFHYADLKSTASVEEEACQRAIGDFGYHMQGALIKIVAPLVGWGFESFQLVFQESKPPHSVRIVAVKNEDLKEGEADCLLALRIFEKCMKAGDWPGPAGHQRDVHWLGMTDWERKRREYRRKQLETEFGK